jgi:integrase
LRNWVWWTIIALCRYGGLRRPSEVLSLWLVDLDWERGEMAVASPKTEGHGQGYRVCPIFARLRPYLDEAYHMATEGQTHVIPEHLYLPAAKGPRGWASSNLRTTFAKILRRAGLEQWPRLFHALRASCESDLAREYPITTVCKWIGNTVAIAARHYVQVTDEDFQRAAENSVQNSGQLTHETPGEPWNRNQKTSTRPKIRQGPPPSTNALVTPTGLEPVLPA